MNERMYKITTPPPVLSGGGLTEAVTHGFKKARTAGEAIQLFFQGIARYNPDTNLLDGRYPVSAIEVPAAGVN